MTTEKLTFTSGQYRLYRTTDGEGDSGGMLRSLNPIDAQPVGENGEVHLGCCVICGSHYARSFQHQDWWLCTTVVEIVEKGEGWAKVRTQSNREYLVGDTFAVSKIISANKSPEKTTDLPSLVS